jgi:hypothetical protein
MYREFAILHFIFHPIESHIHGLRSSDLGPVVGESVCGRAISCQSRGLRLFAAQFFQDLSGVGTFLAIVEEGPNFRLLACRHDVFHNTAFHMYRAIGV